MIAHMSKMSRKRLIAAPLHDLLSEESSDYNIASNEDNASATESETGADSDSSVAADAAVSGTAHDHRDARGVHRCRERGRGHGRGSRTADCDNHSQHNPSRLCFSIRLLQTKLRGRHFRLSEYTSRMTSLVTDSFMLL